MNQIILYRQGAYQVYDPELRCAVFSSALTLIEIVQHLREEFGSKIFRTLHQLFDAAYLTGCSDGSKLFATILNNNHRLTPEQFVGKYLSL